MPPNRVSGRTTITAVVLGLVVGMAAPASANHEAPFDGSAHAYGDMVDYPLAFPVVGSYWYEDWFWAARGVGEHHAQDLMAAKLTPVVAAAAGTVTWINWSQDPNDLNPERCCTVVITHDDGWESWYIHLNNDTPGTDDGLAWGIAPEIALGTHVAAGDLIGWVGDSGSAENTGPHLHFELYDPEGVLVNPHDALLAAEGRAHCGITRVGDVTTLLSTSGLIKVGAAGDAVRQLQEFLAAFRHAPGPIDGIFGSRTLGAVRGFQTEVSLASDGVVGSMTRAEVAELVALASRASVLDPDGRSLRQGSLGGDVAELQGLLKAVGLDVGAADGIFGSKTTAAVRAFQNANGLFMDGVVGRATRARLAAVLHLTPLVSCS
ncbi:MAG: peptidoglycan-binding protein [Acidimicrobiia bacterium]|nr:peptidoglycan-binding protein [Acidimicrobiia bacterium]